jgi:hypothetical protein
VGRDGSEVYLCGSTTSHALLIRWAGAGTTHWDVMVRDERLGAIHRQLAGGAMNISATYYIEKHGPAPGGGMHNGGFPKDKNIHYGCGPAVICPGCQVCVTTCLCCGDR